MDSTASTDLLMAQLQAACSHIPNLRQHEDRNGIGLSNRNQASDRHSDQGLIVQSLLQNSNSAGQAPTNHGLMDLMHGEFMDGHNWLASNNSVATNLQTLGPIQASSVLQSSPWATSNTSGSQNSALVQSILADQNGLLNAVVDLASKGSLNNNNGIASQNFFRSASNNAIPSNGSDLLALGNSNNKQLPHFLDNKLGLRPAERNGSLNLEANQLSAFGNLWRAGIQGLDGNNVNSTSPNETNNGNNSNGVSKSESQQLWPHISSDQDIQANNLMSKWRSTVGLNGTSPMIDKLSLDSIGKSISNSTFANPLQGQLPSPGSLSGSNALRHSDSLPDAASVGKESMANLSDPSSMMPPTLALDLAPPGESNNLIGRFGIKTNLNETSQQNGTENGTQHFNWPGANSSNVSHPNTEQDLMYSFMQERDKEKQLSMIGLNLNHDKSKLLSNPALVAGNVRPDFSYSMFPEASRENKWNYPLQQSLPQQQTNGMVPKQNRNGYNSSDSDNAEKAGQEEVLHPDLNAEHCAENLLAGNNSSRKRSLEKDGNLLEWGSNGREKRPQFTDNSQGVNWEEEEEEEEEMTKDKHQAMVEALLPRRPGPRRKSGPVTAPCAAARERRERIACHIRTLQRLVPSRNKMDSASVLADTIRFLKQLLKQIQEMKAERGELSGDKDMARLTMGSGSGDLNDTQRGSGCDKGSPSRSINGNNSQSPNTSTC